MKKEKEKFEEFDCETVEVIKPIYDNQRNKIGETKYVVPREMAEKEIGRWNAYHADNKAGPGNSTWMGAKIVQSKEEKI